MATNFYKQQQRRFDIARNYERSLGAAKGAPLMLRTMEAPNTNAFGRKVFAVNVDTNAPRVKVLKNGRRRIIHK